MIDFYLRLLISGWCLTTAIIVVAATMRYVSWRLAMRRTLREIRSLSERP